MVFVPAVGQYLLFLGGNIGEFYTSIYILSCSYPTACSIFSALLHCFLFFWFFMPVFSSLFLLQVQHFSAVVTCSICIFGERHLASNVLVVIPLLAVLSVGFCIAFCSFGFSCLVLVVCSYDMFNIFQ